MKLRFFALALCCLVDPLSQAAFSQTSTQSAQTAQPFIAHIHEYPSLWQEDPRGHFPGDGSAFCVPVAASNALMWLADHGYPKIVPDPTAPRTDAAQYAAAQISLVSAITTAPYATMIAHHGASTHWVSMGIKKYLTDHGYVVTTLEDATVEPSTKPETVSAAPSQPDATSEDDEAASAIPSIPVRRTISLDTLKGAFRDGAVIWIMIGRYHPVPGVPDTYKRTSGHALTLVGYGMNEQGQLDPSVLIVHDPAKHSGRFWPNSFCHLAAIDHGHWPGKGAAVGQPGKSMAGGRYQMDPQLPSHDGEVTLLEDAAILQMAPAPAQKP